MEPLAVLLIVSSTRGHHQIIFRHPAPKASTLSHSWNDLPIHPSTPMLTHHLLAGLLTPLAQLSEQRFQLGIDRFVFIGLPSILSPELARPVEVVKKETTTRRLRRRSSAENPSPEIVATSLAAMNKKAATVKQGAYMPKHAAIRNVDVSAGEGRMLRTPTAKKDDKMDVSNKALDKVHRKMRHVRTASVNILGDIYHHHRVPVHTPPMPPTPTTESKTAPIDAWKDRRPLSGSDSEDDYNLNDDGDTTPHLSHTETLTTFHFVLVLREQNDPLLSDPTSGDVVTTNMPEYQHARAFVQASKNMSNKAITDEVFRRMIRPITVGLGQEQSRCGYVRKEAEVLLSLIDNAMHRNVTPSTNQFKMDFGSLHRDMLQTSSLAKELAQVYELISSSRMGVVRINDSLPITIHALRRAPPAPPSTAYLQPHTENTMPTGTAVFLHDIHYGQSDTQDDANDDYVFGASQAYTERRRSIQRPFLNRPRKDSSLLVRLRYLRPYHTVLLTDEDADTLIKMLPSTGNVRMVLFLEHLSPMLTLQQISASSSLGLLEVYQLASELVDWRKARIIDTVHVRNMYILAPDADLSKLDHVTVEFDERFAPLKLCVLLSELSNPHSTSQDAEKTPHAFRSLLAIIRSLVHIQHQTQRKTKASTLSDHSFVGLFLEAVTFLLRHDLLTQVHTYAYLLIPKRVHEGASTTPHHHNIHHPYRQSQDMDDDSIDDVLRSGYRTATTVTSNGNGASTILGASMILTQSNAIVNVEAEEALDTTGEPWVLPHRPTDDTFKSNALEREWIQGLTYQVPKELAHHFLRLVPYFDGQHSVDEIAWREGLDRQVVFNVLGRFRDELITVVY